MSNSQEAAKEWSMKVRVDRANERVKQLRVYDPNAVSEATGLDVSDEECKVQQQFKDECDINNILRRYGAIPQVAPEHQGVYGDFTGIHDYESALEKVSEVMERFMLLPAEVRERFGNDPARLVHEASLMTEEQLDLVIPPASEGEPPGHEAGAGNPPPPVSGGQAPAPVDVKV